MIPLFGTLDSHLLRVKKKNSLSLNCALLSFLRKCIAIYQIMQELSIIPLYGHSTRQHAQQVYYITSNEVMQYMTLHLCIKANKLQTLFTVRKIR